MKKDLKQIQDAYDAMRSAASRSVGDEQYHAALREHYEVIRLALHDWLGLNKQPRKLKEKVNESSQK